MKIKKVKINNHKKQFEITTSERSLVFPYWKLEIPPTSANPVVKAYPDKELGNDAFTCELKSGAEETLHIDDILEYNRDPKEINNLTLYKLTIAAQKAVKKSHSTKREIARRLHTSPSQLIRLLDQTNYKKSIDGMLALLSALEVDVEFKIKNTCT